MVDGTPTYVLIALAYGLFGVLTSCVYGFFPSVRRENVFHLTALSLAAAATVLAVTAGSMEFYVWTDVHRGTRFFLFLTASFCYVPTFVYIGLHYWNLLIHRLLSPGATGEEKPKKETYRQQVQQVRDYLEILSKDTGNTKIRERLGNLYLRMGFFDSAVYEYRKTSEWLPRGYAHAKVLYKAAHVLAEKRQDLTKAAPLLRRILRLYPKSYFASYARRVLNRYEAHAEKNR
jgi:tetratricopeptide (TPR) repeat protein